MSKEDPGANLFLKESKFEAGSDNIKYLPKYALPEIAFMGRSNVGKSSLINALCGRKSLARTSRTPGRTRQINLFSVGGSIILADLPGYGFAEVPLSVKKKWEKTILSYIKERENLQTVAILIDSRRGVGSADLEIMELLSSVKRDFFIVLTKIDKIKNLSELMESSKKTLETFGLPCNVIPTCSRIKDGAKELRRSLGRFAGNIR